jgi:hypothetical protein
VAVDPEAAAARSAGAPAPCLNSWEEKPARAPRRHARFELWIRSPPGSPPVRHHHPRAPLDSTRHRRPCSPCRRLAAPLLTPIPARGEGAEEGSRAAAGAPKDWRSRRPTRGAPASEHGREQGARPRDVCTWLLPQKLDPIVNMDDSPVASVAVAAAPSSTSPRSPWWVR